MVKKHYSIICYIDVETISINNIKLPIAVSFDYQYYKLNYFVILIDSELFKIDRELAIHKL